MERGVDAGKIPHRGVSNLDCDVDDMDELVAASDDACHSDQILHNLSRRKPEHHLLPRLADHSLTIMAESLAKQERPVDNPALADMAADRGATHAQVALASLLALNGVIAFFEADSVALTRENGAAADLVLAPDVLNRSDVAYPKLTGSVPLVML